MGSTHASRTDRSPTDSARFDQLWAQRRHVAAFVRRCGARPEAVDDVVAETYLVAWRRRDRAPIEADQARAWLCTVARNVLANVRRRSQRQIEIGRRLAASTGGHDGEGGRWLAAEAFRSLRAGDRHLLWLVGTSPLTAAELGREVGCSPAAAAVRVSRARRRLDEAALT